MAHQIQGDPAEYRLSDEPEWVVGLPGDERLDAALLNGRWLLVSAAVWSAPDMVLVRELIAAARRSVHCVRSRSFPSPIR
ncbi:MAG: hypothetical protein QM783_12710 [Phycisphaerales bacterium]